MVIREDALLERREPRRATVVEVDLDRIASLRIACGWIAVGDIALGLRNDETPVDRHRLRLLEATLVVELLRLLQVEDGLRVLGFRRNAAEQERQQRQGERTLERACGSRVA